MKITHATRNAVRAFTGTWKSHGGEWYRFWDSITNGWAAVSSGWNSFWESLREWGGSDYKSLAQDAAANPHAGRGLRIIIDSGSSVRIAGQREQGDEFVEAEIQALEVIERTGWDRIWASFVWGMYCGGEVFIQKRGPATGPNAGTARELTVLRNDLLLEIKYDEQGDPSEYVFQGADGKPIKYPAEDVLHIKTYNPLNPNRGLPLLVSARRQLTLVAEADTWNRSIAKGAGRVPGYWSPTGLAPGRQLTDQQVKDAQDLFNRASADIRSRNIEMVLSGSFERTQGDVSPKEADWLKGREVSMREIAAVIGVPAALLGDEKGGSLTDAGVDSEIASLFKLTIIPMVENLLAELTKWLCKEKQRIVADWDQIQALQEDIDAKFLRYTVASRPGGPLTRKEARVALGYDADPQPDMVDEARDDTFDDLEQMGDDQFKSLLKLVA